MTSTGPTVVRHVSFLSPDRKIWCRIDDRAWCVTARPEHSGTLTRNGEVEICEGPGPGSCTQNWHDDAPVLRRGQRSERNGFRCAAAANGITCTVLAGAGRGKGFLINARAVTLVGPG